MNSKHNHRGENAKPENEDVDDVTKVIKEIDSPINKDYDGKSDGRESLTPDESANTDPNEVDDKPSFTNDNN